MLGFADLRYFGSEMTFRSKGMVVQMTWKTQGEMTTQIFQTNMCIHNIKICSLRRVLLDILAWYT